jgi:hypothetical protein
MEISVQLKELTARDIQDIVNMASARDAIDRPEEYTLGEAIDPTAWSSWSLATGKLVARIDELSPEAVAELMAVAWLGRGDSGDDFNALVAHAHSNLRDASKYLAAKSPLHTYLRDGAKKIGVAV